MHSMGGAEPGWGIGAANSSERLSTEDTLIAELREIVATAAPNNLVLGIGDDAAAWRPSRSNLSVITTDALVEGVHFTVDAMSAAEVGHRALASNLSDIAAMGARPVLATIAFGIGARSDATWIRDCYRGLAALAVRAKCAIAGGDLVRSPAITLSITIVGEVRASNIKRRSGARAGDVIAVTGPLGASRAGLLVALDRPDLAADPAAADVLAAYRTPEPRLREGRWLAAASSVHAMMDCSDGLSTDLARMATASGLGAVIDTIPVHPGARAVAEAVGDDAERYARDGGEDFELLVAVAPRAFRYIAGRYRARFGSELVAVGHFTPHAGVLDAAGSSIAAAGWDHLASPPRE